MVRGSLEEILAQIRRQYQTEIVSMKVAGRMLRFLQIKNLDEIVFQWLASGDPETAELPFWGKIWEASLFLGAYLVAQPVVPGRQILEIGSGMGVAGLFAAASGHQVSLSDYREEILLFLRANALLNGLDQVAILKIDWSEPPPPHSYDWIVGSEVVHHRPTYDCLVNFLDGALKPGGTIFLAKSRDLPASGFFVKLTRRFKFKKLEKKCAPPTKTMRSPSMPSSGKPKPNGEWGMGKGRGQRTEIRGRRADDRDHIRRINDPNALNAHREKAQEARGAGILAPGRWINDGMKEP